ncbi:hypothetical protein [Vibrio harveyi]|uniref:hypothetical protein n=1 Tax=Vibrio harveyi TaxID=669 RepID=UPI001F3360F2|nr:hypothetical protein [Vibrio harveyi]
MRFLILLVVTFQILPSAAKEMVTINKTIEIEWPDLILEEERDRISASRMKALSHNLKATQQIKVGAVREK